MGCINTAVVVATEEMQGQKEGHSVNLTLKEEPFPKVSQNMLQVTGSITMAASPCQGPPSDLGLSQPS